MTEPLVEVPAQAVPFTPVQPVRRKPRRFRRFLLLTSFLLATVYAGGAYGATQSDRVRDAYSQTLPGGPAIIDALDEYFLQSLGATKGKSRSVSDEALTKSRETARKTGIEARERKEQARLHAERKAQEAKDALAAASDKAADKASSAKDAVIGAAHTASAVVAEKAQEVKDAVTPSTDSKKAAKDAEEAAISRSRDAKVAIVHTADAAAEKAKEAGSKIEGALSNMQDQAVSAVDSAASSIKSAMPSEPGVAQPIRSHHGGLDPTPQPPKEPAGQPYTGPPLPIGSEPPPGYYLAKPKKASAPAKPAPPAPLPLVAPSVSSLSAQEPVLGQIASTIDSLAGFLNTTPAAIANDGPIKAVLQTAEMDLKSLGDRLEKVKAEEHQALAERLEKQKQEYQVQLEGKERDLWDKLGQQEEDWRSAFDAERQQLVGAYRSKLEAELETQKEIINERLREEVIAQGIEMQRRWLRDIKMRVEKERGGRLARLEELSGSVKTLEKVTMENDEYLSESLQVNTLWSAIRATQSAEGRPFTEELRALKELSTADSTIATALSSIPAETASTGIAPLHALSAWFTTKLAPRIKMAALMPDNGGCIAYAASSVLSPLLFSRSGFSLGEDVMSVLNRADFYLNQKDLDRATREINQLTVSHQIIRPLFTLISLVSGLA